MTSVSIPELNSRIGLLYRQGADADAKQAREVFAQLRDELSAGRVRSAEPDRSTSTGWRVNTWVKEGILVGFRAGKVVSFPSPHKEVSYLDKDTLPLRSLTPSSGSRIAPGGSSTETEHSSARESSVCPRCTSISVPISVTVV